MESVNFPHNIRIRVAESDSNESQKLPSIEENPSPEEDEDDTNTVVTHYGEETKYVSPDAHGVSHGCISVVGRRRSMEDTVSILVNGELSPYEFYAIFDGHGGTHASSLCQERLHAIVGEEMVRRRRMIGDDEFVTGGQRFWSEVMSASFARMDMEALKGEPDCRDTITVGSTALVVMVGRHELIVANCGDCRAVLYRDGEILPMSEDHKPDRPDERKRIVEAGGQVVKCDGNRVCGVLATSRSIGDRILKRYVISEPEVRVTCKTIKDEFIVMASDGLWDLISNEIACKIAKACFTRPPTYSHEEGCEAGIRAAEASALLAALAMYRGSEDNITCIVINLTGEASASGTKMT